MAAAVRLGIIGYGAQGGMYARMLRENRIAGLVLGAVCDNDPQQLATAAEENPGVPCHDRWQDVLTSGEVDAVVTTVPHYLHPEMAIAAIDAGIHVLVEKPAGVYGKQVRELNEFAATRPEVTFAVMFNQRMNPLYQHIKRIVDAGEIGAIRHTNWVITTWWRPQGYYDQSEWRATWGGEGGGVLVNQVPHQLDLWQWICGVPQTVFSKVAYGFRRDIAVEDEVTILVDYGQGATGVLVTATHDLVGTDRFEILGDRGKIVVDGSRTATVTRLAKDERQISNEMTMAQVKDLFAGKGGLDKESLISTETLEYDRPWGQQHGDVLENFAANILDGTPLVAPGADGMNGVRLANAVHLSSWLGREVPIDIDEDEYLRELNARIREEGRFPERDA